MFAISRGVSNHSNLLSGLISGEEFAISLEVPKHRSFLSELVEKCLRSRKVFQSIKTCSVA